MVQVAVGVREERANGKEGCCAIAVRTNFAPHLRLAVDARQGAARGVGTTNEIDKRHERLRSHGQSKARACRDSGARLQCRTVTTCKLKQRCKSKTSFCYTLRASHEGDTMETSAQLLHTCVLSSQSHRHPSTYSPGVSVSGSWTRSTIIPSVQSPLHCPSTSTESRGSPRCANHPSSCGQGGSNCRHPGPRGPSPVPFFAFAIRHPVYPGACPEECESKSMRGIGFIDH
jgi:hypothetical protein